VDRLLTALSSGSDRILRPIQPSPERPDVPRYEIFHDRLGQAILGWLSRFGASEAANEAARKATIAASSPLSRVEVEASSPEDTHTSGLSLCFTGGGFRAMLFHVGALWRLNEVGLLSTAAQISSVSAGSLVAAKLGAVWGDLGFDANGIAARFEAALVAPLRALAEKTIDVRSALAGTLLPFTTPADRFVHELEKTFARACNACGTAGAATNSSGRIEYARWNALALFSRLHGRPTHRSHPGSGHSPVDGRGGIGCSAASPVTLDLACLTPSRQRG
jgi:hypothetical protein